MIPTLATCGLIAMATLGVGGALTTIGPWYLSLRVPRWKPPNWAFGPVWGVIGACAASSAALAWLSAASRGQRIEIVALFAVNIVLNIVWSLLFFKLRRPDWAMIEVVPLWLSVAVPLVALWPIRRLSSVLLFPYLLWLTVAATLNLFVVRANAPFGKS